MTDPSVGTQVSFHLPSGEVIVQNDPGIAALSSSVHTSVARPAKVIATNAIVIISFFISFFLSLSKVRIR